LGGVVVPARGSIMRKTLRINVTIVKKRLSVRVLHGFSFALFSMIRTMYDTTTTRLRLAEMNASVAKIAWRAVDSEISELSFDGGRAREEESIAGRLSLGQNSDKK